MFGNSLSSSFEQCINNANVRAGSDYEWGVAGGINGGAGSSVDKEKGSSFTNCYNTGNISSPKSHIGGFTGFLRSGEIINCYNIGNVSGSVFIGGIVGELGLNNVGGKINNVYNLNSASIVGNSYVGSIYGQKWSGTVTLTDNINEATLKTYAKVLDENIWTEDINNINNGYPILKWQLEI